MKVADFDKAQPISIEQIRPGDMIAMTAAEDAREVEKVMREQSIGLPPRLWVTWAGYSEAQIFTASAIVWVCMD